MNKLIRSKKYTGVYYRTNKSKDRVYYFTYKDSEHQSKKIRVGLRSDGINEKDAFEARTLTISELKMDKVPTILTEKQAYKVTLDECATYYFDNHQTKTTEKRRRQYINHIKTIFGAKNVYKITASDVEKFKNQLMKDYAPQTVRMSIELIGTIYSYNIKYRNLKLTNPVLAVAKPRVDNRRLRFLSKDEVGQLFDALKFDFQLTLFTSLALCTASRKKTILNYSIKDVDLENHLIQSYDFKRDSTYQSFLDDQTIALLKVRIQQCTSPNEKLISIQGIRDIDRWISREMKVVLDNLFNLGLSANDKQNRVVIHSLRHTVLSQLGLQNANVFLIKQISNHSSTSMVERYVKLNKDSGKREIEHLWS